MTVRFFLFEQNEETLYAQLGKADWSRKRLIELFKLLPGAPTVNGSNNPWRATDAWDKEIPINGDLGFGEAYLGEKDDVVSLFRSLKEHGVGHVAGLDVPLGIFAEAPAWEHWCPGTGRAGSVGIRDQAERLMGAQALSSEELTGRDVNVFIVDQGLSKSYVERQGGHFGGGLSWPILFPKKTPGQFDQPYMKRPREHGNMIVRNVLALAPDARIFDIPLLPPRIDNVHSFGLEAVWAYWILRLWLIFISGRSVVVNPWGIFNRFSEPLLGDYTTNPDHPMTRQVDRLAKKHDVVFAAGNSGQFCPNPRSGPYDRGPGRSIWGANAHHRVISVGAARSDATWIGASSQGPGPEALAQGGPVNEKPDICAPSWFRENHDAHLVNTGTSAACGVAAGVVAALRQHWSVPPDEMKAALRDGARAFWHSGWNGRMGEGILNVPGTISNLPA